MGITATSEIQNITTKRKLDELFKRTDLFMDDEFGRKVFDTDLTDPLMVEVIGLVTDVFINKDGQPNRTNIQWFKDHSDYRVFPGEKDSFGWLTAGIQKLNGPVLWFG